MQLYSIKEKKIEYNWNGKNRRKHQLTKTNRQTTGEPDNKTTGREKNRYILLYILIIIIEQSIRRELHHQTSHKDGKNY